MLCKDRSKYVFWDEYHPTDRANELMAKEFLKKFGLAKANEEEDDPNNSQAPATTYNANGTGAHN